LTYFANTEKQSNNPILFIKFQTLDKKKLHSLKSNILM